MAAQTDQNMSLLRIFYRLTCLLIICIIFTVIGIALKLVFSYKEKKRYHYITLFTRHWARWFCFFLNIKVEIIGEYNPSSHALIVSNHVGSPDIFVLGSCFKTFFVSKDEVGAWPLIGYLASLGATIFVDRSRRHQVSATISAIQKRLQEGFSVVVFPEGWATDGADILPFKPSSFQAAVLSQQSVVPVMIRYLDSYTLSVACWHNTDFFSHMLRLLKNEELKVRVEVLSEIASRDDRRFLANESRRLIREAHQKSKIISSLESDITGCSK